MSEFVKLLVARLVREEEGQDLVEYALLVGLIAIACIAGVTLLGGSVNGLFTALGNAVSGWGAPL